MKRWLGVVAGAAGVWFDGCGAANAAELHASRSLAENQAVQAHAASDDTTPAQAAVHAAQEAVQRAQQAEQSAQASPGCNDWTLWQSYARRFVSDDGRVIDRTAADERTTSEGQSYALFFALVAGDRARFDRILDWTASNLAQGDLKTHLPAWHWGRREDGAYGVIDENAASDADLWLAYALIEGARLWNVARYRELAIAIAANVVQHEVVTARGLGAVLLPGPHGFALEHDAFSLNPSYLVLPIFRRMSSAAVPGPWRGLVKSSVRVLSLSAPRGLAPDWIAYSEARGFEDDARGAFGSYDAIRVYLWAALLPKAETQRRALQRNSDEFVALVDRIGRVPERIAVRSAEVSEANGPPGFLAVALASAKARGNQALADELETRLERTKHDGLYGDPPAYYDQNLALFSLGFIEGRFGFAADGGLRLAWDVQTCSS